MTSPPSSSPCSGWARPNFSAMSSISSEKKKSYPPEISSILLMDLSSFGDLPKKKKKRICKPSKNLKESPLPKSSSTNSPTSTAASSKSKRMKFSSTTKTTSPSLPSPTASPNRSNSPPSKNSSKKPSSTLEPFP